MTKLRSKKMKTIGLAMFFSLVVVVLILILTLVAFYYLSNGVSTGQLPTNEIAEGGPSFTLTTTKGDLNQFLNKYLETEALQKENINYTVRVDEEIILEGTIIALNTDVPFVMTFDPEVLANGDLLLKQSKFSIAKINVPAQILLQLINNSYSFPEGVMILPDQRSIYFSLGKVNPNGNFKVKAERFDLQNDHIQFKVYYRPLD